MDFFASQELARRNTRKLIGLLLLTVVCLTLTTYALAAGIFVFAGREKVDEEQLWTWFWSIENLELFGLSTIGVVTVVGLGMLYKISELRGGGSVVANMLGGRRILSNTTDLAERRLLNVVEEMAIASGVPVPPVYVLDGEEGINAFAAGYTIDDAIIGVNRGTLNKLNRDELQGVIGHEFSHILNGDMRMSLRMIGLLHGILVIALIGYQILRTMGRSSGSSRSDKKGGAGAILLFGAGLVAIGSAGLFFARLIKASISRQREYLADASSVQFTRNPLGISGALKMIGANQETSKVENANAETISHMFFANMTGSLMTSPFATHPPLVARIQRIEPAFVGDFSDYARRRPTASVLGGREEDAAGPAKKTAQSPLERFGLKAKFRSRPATAEMIFDPAILVATIGEPSQEDVIYSRYLLGRISTKLQDAIHDVFLARCVVFASLLDKRPEIREKQIESLNQLEDEGTTIHVLELETEIASIEIQYRLPIFEILQGTLVGLSENQFRKFRGSVVHLIETDKEVSLFEFFLRHHLIGHLERHFGRGLPHAIYFHQLEPLRTEIELVLSVLAEFGHTDLDSGEKAFRAAAETLPQGIRNIKYAGSGWDYPKLAHAIKKLSLAAPIAKKQFLSAAAVSITHDREITVIEAEMFRALGESLDCPVPPIVAH